jgi:hypothetical protein
MIRGLRGVGMAGFGRRQARRAAATAASLLMLSGCAAYQPQPYKATMKPQEVLGPAQSWNQVAASVATQLAAALPAGTQRVYLAMPSDRRATFYRAFTVMLTTEFLKRGVAVSSDPASAYKATITVVMLRHPTADAEAVVSAQLTHGPLTVAASTGSFFINGGTAREYRSPAEPSAPLAPLATVNLVSAR